MESSTKKTVTFSPSTIIRDDAKRGLLELDSAIAEADPCFSGMELFVELLDLIADLTFVWGELINTSLRRRMSSITMERLKLKPGDAFSKHLNTISSLVKEIPCEGERKEMQKGVSEASYLTCKIKTKLCAYALKTKHDLQDMTELSESAQAREEKLKQLLDVKCQRLADLEQFEQKLISDRENFDREVSSAMEVMNNHKSHCDKVLEEAKKAAAPCRFLTQAERDVVKLKHMLKKSEEENEQLKQELQRLRPKDAQREDHLTQPDKKPRRTKSKPARTRTVC